MKQPENKIIISYDKIERCNIVPEGYFYRIVVACESIYFVY